MLENLSTKIPLSHFRAGFNCAKRRLELDLERNFTDYSIQYQVIRKME